MKMIDLSKTIKNGMDVYPGDPEVKVKVTHTHEKNSWLLRELTLGTHTGTHVDAPSHMDPRGKTLDDIPLTSFFGTSMVVKPNPPFPERTGLFFVEQADMDILDDMTRAEPPFVGGNITLELQRGLLKEGVVTYTDLVNLHLIPVDSTFTFVGFPLKIAEGDGSPVRCVALL